MGFLDKVRGALDKATDKMDSLSEPGPLAGHQWPPDQPMAVLVESEHRPGSRGSADSKDEGILDLAIDRAAGIPYRFVLDVHRPGIEPYQIEQQVRIPSKVQRSWTQGEVHVPPGTEVPLTVTGPGFEDVEIDWHGYLALPGRKQRAEQLRAGAQWDRMGADFERTNPPEQVQKIHADHRLAAFTWADAVLEGWMTREAFDHETDMAIRMGFLLPADYAEAKAKLDG
jgi:hypothetical protein